MMAPPRKHDDATRSRVVEIYQQGAKMDAIEEETGVPRSTVYLILGEAGVGPSRLPSIAKRGEGASGLAFVMERLLETNTELTQARAEIDSLRAENATLRQKLSEARARARGSSQN